jgi:hypothetical protein
LEYWSVGFGELLQYSITSMLQYSISRHGLFF